MRYALYSKIKLGQQGYTMLEILMVVAIGAILVAVAVPSLQDTIRLDTAEKIKICSKQVGNEQNQRQQQPV
jgi:prepilin-type N-terminal cleavage/methylation domain-containing protein